MIFFENCCFHIVSAKPRSLIISYCIFSEKCNHSMISPIPGVNYLIKFSSLMKLQNNKLEFFLYNKWPWDRIHNTSFSSYLKYKPSKLECFITPH